MLNSAQEIRAAADQCVKCGLCLPHCPTYRQSQNEGESPRGRIALIQALADQQLAVTTGTAEHLDSCLGCLNCEAVCPAKVDYAGLIDAGRTLVAEHTGKPRASRLARAMTYPAGQRWMRRLLSVYVGSGLQWLARRLRFAGSHRLARLDAMLPPGVARRPHHVDQQTRPKAPPAHPSVQLFAGCTGTLFDQQTLTDTQRLLEALGYAVEPMTPGLCCGALHAHGGDPDRAAVLGQRWREQASGQRTILGIASGCSAHLQRQVLAGRAEPVMQDLSQWLDTALASAKFQPRPQRWALHLPCSLRNDLKTVQPLKRALERIPQLELVEFGPASGCCGAAGRHLTDRPAQADQLLQPYLTELQALQVDGVLSANVGCSLHLRQGLTLGGQPLPVKHPVSLLADQLLIEA